MPISNHPQRILMARDVMAKSPVSIHPDVCIFEAINLLLKNSVTGMPVIDDDHRLVGILSEYDCLRVLASSDFYELNEVPTDKVSQYMTKQVKTIHPDMGIYMVAQELLNQGVQRLPVVENGLRLGMVTRAHVLRGIEKMRKQRMPRKHFPEFRLPLRNSRGHVD
ncbi:MAG: CBS domain-containing protein [Deltaproteobacteria bacterium]|nr:CBS domain-containing protein [Deltaproteobacteria bacterium]